jgi:hypothetical protein
VLGARVVACPFAATETETTTVAVTVTGPLSVEVAFTFASPVELLPLVELLVELSGVMLLKPRALKTEIAVCSLVHKTFVPLPVTDGRATHCSPREQRCPVANCPCLEHVARMVPLIHAVSPGVH